MYMRLVQVEVKEGELDRLRELYSGLVIPTLQDVAGCRYAGLMQSAQHHGQCISLTLWDSQEEAQAYESGGVFRRLMDETRPYLTESSEFKIQLSEDLTLEYVPIPQEPVVKAYPVAAQSGMDESRMHNNPAMWLRIVSLKILPGKLDEFKRLYAEHALPALRKVKGCRYVYMLESEEKNHEVFSVTSWDSKQDAENYEQSGLFEQLLKAQQHTLSDLYQWKKSLGKQQASHSATSEDVMVEHYTILTGKNFK